MGAALYPVPPVRPGPARIFAGMPVMKPTSLTPLPRVLGSKSRSSKRYLHVFLATTRMTLCLRLPNMYRQGTSAYSKAILANSRVIVGNKPIHPRSNPKLPDLQVPTAVPRPSTLIPELLASGLHSSIFKVDSLMLLPGNLPPPLTRTPRCQFLVQP